MIKPVILLIINYIIIVVFTGKADTLSLNDYVKLSIKNSPQHAISQSLVNESYSSRQAILAQSLPQINSSLTISRSATWGGIYNATRLPKIYNNNSAAGISGQLKVFDFGKTFLQYKAAGKSILSAENDLHESIATIILNAKTAYFNYLLSEKILSVNEDALKLAAEHLNQAKILFEAGENAKIFITNAMVDVANAEVSVVHAKNTVLLAKIQLETVSATKILEPFLLSDSLNGVEDSISIDDAEKIGLESRSEILSARAKLEAAKINFSAVKVSFSPTVSVTGNFDWVAQDSKLIDSKDWTPTPNWKLAADISLPLFDGGTLYAQIAKAKALVMQSQGQLDAITLDVTHQIEQFYLQEIDARQRIKAAAIVILQASENLKLAQGRYKTGVGFSVELTDAEYLLANGRTSHAQAYFDYHIAHANLLFAIGNFNE